MSLKHDWSKVNPEKLKADAAFYVNKAKVAILRNETFCVFSGVMAVGANEFIDVGTAATDGWNTFYDPAFINDAQKIDEKHVRFVVLHEVIHKAFSHIEVWHKRLRKELVDTMSEDELKEAAFNNFCEQAACDIFVNTTIKEMDPEENFAKNFSWAFQHEEWAKGLSVGNIFRELKYGKRKVKGVPQDKHAIQILKEGEGGPPRPGDQIIKRTIENELRTGKLASAAIRNANGKKAGTGSNGESFDITAFGGNNIPWYETLRECFIEDSILGNDHTSWSRVNRRMLSGYDIYMPSMIGHACGEMVVGIDTSASVSNEELSDMMGSLSALILECNPTKLWLLWVDYAVTSVQELYPVDYPFLASLIKPTGRGGTDMVSIFTWIKSKEVKPVGVIVMTDGDTPYPKSVDFPTYWVLTSRRNKAPEHAGQTLYLD